MVLFYHHFCRMVGGRGKINLFLTWMVASPNDSYIKSKQIGDMNYLGICKTITIELVGLFVNQIATAVGPLYRGLHLQEKGGIEVAVKPYLNQHYNDEGLPHVLQCVL